MKTFLLFIEVLLSHHLAFVRLRCCCCGWKVESGSCRHVQHKLPSAGSFLAPKTVKITDVISVFRFISFKWWRSHGFGVFSFTYSITFFLPRRKDARNSCNFLHINSSSVLAQGSQKIKILSIKT